MDRENSNITILTVKIETIITEEEIIITTTVITEIIITTTVIIIKEGTTVTTVKMVIVLITWATKIVNNRQWITNRLVNLKLN